MPEPLKPCPFCGRKALGMQKAGLQFVSSGCCGMEMLGEAWNRRAMPQEVRELLGALHFAIDRCSDHERRLISEKWRAVYAYHGEAKP